MEGVSFPTVGSFIVRGKRKRNFTIQASFLPQSGMESQGKSAVVQQKHREWRMEKVAEIVTVNCMNWELGEILVTKVEWKHTQDIGGSWRIVRGDTVIHLPIQTTGILLHTQGRTLEIPNMGRGGISIVTRREKEV